MRVEFIFAHVRLVIRRNRCKKQDLFQRDTRGCDEILSSSKRVNRNFQLCDLKSEVAHLPRLKMKWVLSEINGATFAMIFNSFPKGCHRCKCVVSGRGWICTTKCIENESDQALTSENLSTSESWDVNPIKSEKFNALLRDLCSLYYECVSFRNGAKKELHIFIL